MAQLAGDEVEFRDWEESLRRPFDPSCERVPHDGGLIWALRSRSLDHLETAEEVRERALLLIDRLNGALSLEAGTQPLKFDAVVRIDDQGVSRRYIFAEISEKMRATTMALAEASGYHLTEESEWGF